MEDARSVAAAPGTWPSFALALQVGQVVDLNRVAGEPVEMSVNGKVVARGELVEVEGHLGVRILSLAG